MATPPCPTREQLEQLADHRLSDFDRAAVETHVLLCPACRDSLLGLRGDPPPSSRTVVTPPPAADPPPIPDGLRDHPRYRIVERLGSGGMGAVYKAEHLLLERPVVLKVIRGDLLDRPDVAERFGRELRLAARLAHPNVVAVYEAEQVAGAQVLVMEYVAGTDLAEVARRRGRVSVAEACDWVRQAAAGLQHLHERGLVHRDVKPSNLMLTPEGVVKLLDLGVAVAKDEENHSAKLTAERQVLGTLDYMAPEQWEGSHDVDIRADVYSLGCTLFHLLAGEAPFPNTRYKSVMRQMWAHSQSPLPPIRDVRPDMPPALAGVLDRMLAKTPEQRFAAPGEVVAALEPFARASPGGPPRRPGRWRRLAVGLAALLVLAACGWLVADRLGLPGSRPAAPPAESEPLRVGVLHSRTGTMAGSERGVIDATLFALEEVNAGGGALGRRVEAVVEDGESDPATFAAKAEKLIVRDEVRTVFGCWTSASRKTVKPLFEKHDHLLVYPVQYEGLEQSPNIVYLGAAPNQQIIPAVKWCCSVLNKKRLFLVGSDYVFPRAANAIIRDEAAGLGCAIVGEEYLPLGGSDVSGITDKIERSQADVILNTINGDSNVAFFRSLRAAGLTPDRVPTVSFSLSEGELSSLGAKTLAGDYSACNYFQTIDTPRNRDFVRRFRQRHGERRAISDAMEAAYAGVHLWARAVRAAGSDDVRAIRAAMKGRSFDAPGGAVRIDPATQHASKVIRIGRLRADGQYEMIYSSEQPIEPVPYPGTRTRAAWDGFLTDLHMQWGGQWADPRR